jgi:stringent starvation protein B
MTSSRPYLIRALYEWILNDNHLTPYVIINATLPGVHVPKEFINNGKIVFNISPEAVNDLFISNSILEFDASFSGIPRHICAPIIAVQAIYAQENNEGMYFGDEPGGDTPSDDTPHVPSKKTAGKKSHLKVIK